MLSKEQIKQFRKIWEKATGKKIGKKEALEKATALLRLVELTYKPLTDEEFKKFKGRKTN